MLEYCLTRVRLWVQSGSDSLVVLLPASTAPVHSSFESVYLRNCQVKATVTPVTQEAKDHKFEASLGNFRRPWRELWPASSWCWLGPLCALLVLEHRVHPQSPNKNNFIRGKVILGLTVSEVSVHKRLVLFFEA